MKKAENSEIELLLRDLASRQAVSTRDEPGPDAGGVHLDADELNAFSEGGLPTVTRNHYLAHVADCERCRRIVTQLAIASGATVRIPPKEGARGSIWKSFASFLSPQVLRYAVPALSLLAVIVVGLTVFRQPAPRDLAEVKAPASEPALRSEKELPVDTPASLDQSKRSEAARPGLLDKLASNKQAQAGGSLAGGESRQLAPKAQSPAAEEPTSSATDFASTPPPQPAPATPGEKDKEEAVAHKRQPPKVDRMESKTEDEKNPSDRAEAARGADMSKKTAPQVGQVQGLYEIRADKGGRLRNEGSIRIVSGRRFRHEGNVWIDTAYDSANDATNVVRGSEQYRALIADEPGIRTIAEQLEGEIILVWKGRTYRIR